jgi:hypothetical protein
MVESQVVLGWLTEGERKRQVADLLRLLELRFPPGAPADLAGLIRSSTDLAQLSRWFDAAATVATLDDFRQACQP